MRLLKTVLCLISALLIIGTLCSCSSGSSGNSTYDSDKIEYSSEAINAVKEWNFTEIEIASELGFNSYYSPEYGTSTATQNEDGSWDVTLKGNMSGYIGDYHDNFETYRFVVTAEVSEHGYVVDISARQAY